MVVVQAQAHPPFPIHHHHSATDASLQSWTLNKQTIDVANHLPNDDVDVAVAVVVVVLPEKILLTIFQRRWLLLRLYDRYDGPILPVIE